MIHGEGVRERLLSGRIIYLNHILDRGRLGVVRRWRAIRILGIRMGSYNFPVGGRVCILFVVSLIMSLCHRRIALAPFGSRLPSNTKDFPIRVGGGGVIVL